MKFVSIVAILFLFTFSVSAGTFRETFDNKELEGWQELVQLNNALGSWEVLNGELRAVSRERFLRLLTTGDDTWRDYTVEFDVKPLNKHGIGAISIAARVQGTWLVHCSVEDPVLLVDGVPLPGERISCNLRNLHDGLSIRLDAGPHPLLHLKKWSHLKLSVEENIIAFSINGKQIMGPMEILNLKGAKHPEFNFDEFPDFLTGGVGFGLANYTAHFDNIAVTGESIPNRGGLPVTPHEKLATTWGNLKRFYSKTHN